jgi:hypothetical protein
MAAGDWAAGSKLVVDSIVSGYNNNANPPTLASIMIQWRVLLPSGSFTAPQTVAIPMAVGTTSRHVIAQVAAALQSIITTERISP